MSYLAWILVVAIVLEMDLIFLTSYALNVRWYCDAMGVSREVRPWWAK